MKLNNVLSAVNQVEKSKFINSIDRICSDAIRTDTKLASKVNKLDGQIKNASNSDIIQLFDLVSPYFTKTIKEQLGMLGARATLLTNILSRDGNSVARLSWIESLYSKEWKEIQEKSRVIKDMLSLDGGLETFGEINRFKIYHACLVEAFTNDHKINRETKVTDDERSVLNVLAVQLDISEDDKAAIEHLVDPIPQDGVVDAINSLREIGLVFVSKKNQTVYVADEIVKILYEIQNRDLAQKHVLRILRTFSDAELSTILKNHRKPIRGVERKDKILTVLKMGLSTSSLLSRDLFSQQSTIGEKKERLKVLIADLDLPLDKLGTTIEERIALIIDALSNCSDLEFNSLSATGFKELFVALQNHFPSLLKMLKEEFELEEQEELNIEKLRAINITPHDILFMLSNDEIRLVVERMGISKRGNHRLNILNSFADATDKLIENYGALARRDLLALKKENIDIAESDIGIKFEEVTKAIFEQLGLDVDEDLRRAINTSKDKADVIISLSEDDVIVAEVKTFKNGDFAKYSSTSRQVKSYVSKCENSGKRVAQALIVAPTFSDDFIESAEMDTEVNISMIEAEGLKKIFDAYKSRRNPKFSAKLFTKGGLLKADLIAKNI